MKQSEARKESKGVPHPLYRGTWSLTVLVNGTFDTSHQVSIRYIAVLGF
ncbi:hypothetical protein [Corynebacterium durum]